MLTKGKVLALLEQVVTGKETFVYQPVSYRPESSHAACRYVHEGKPSCIVGQVLALAGWPLESLVEQEGQGAGQLKAPPGFERITPAAARVLDAAQDASDSQQQWQYALSEARRAMLPKVYFNA